MAGQSNDKPSRGGKLVMGYWDCPYCETRGIRGDQAACPNCGRPRGQVKFYMKGQAQDQEHKAGDKRDIEYVDEEQARYVNRNPDWYCSFCDTLNSDNAESCRSCGASRRDSEMNYFQMQEKLKEQKVQPVQQTPARRSRLPLILLAVAAVVIGIFVFMNGKVTAGHYQISSVSWERAIQVEKNVQYHETGWAVPAGGTVTGQREEIHHYDSVLDHYETYEVQRSRQVIDYYETYYTYTDLGNGMFEQVANQRPVYTTEYYTEMEKRPVYVQVPRYQTLFEYDIWRWTYERTATAEGTDQNPYWPETKLRAGERDGQRSETYRVEITDTDKNTASRYRVSESDWNSLTVGENVYITMSRMGGAPGISDEKGNPLVQLTRDGN